MVESREHLMKRYKFHMLKEIEDMVAAVEIVSEYLAKLPIRFAPKLVSALAAALEWVDCRSNGALHF
jgi:hypothetical protein